METLSIVVIAVIVVLFLAIAGLKLYSMIKLKGLRQTAIDLICEAEKVYDKGKNNEKFKMVLDGVLNALPAPVRIFLNESTIEYFVQSIFDSIKIALDTNTENKE